MFFLLMSPSTFSPAPLTSPPSHTAYVPSVERNGFTSTYEDVKSLLAPQTSNVRDDRHAEFFDGIPNTAYFTLETPESWKYGYWEYNTSQIFRDGFNGFTNLTDGLPGLARDSFVDCSDHSVSMIDLTSSDNDGFMCCMAYPLNNNVNAWLGDAIKAAEGADLKAFNYDADYFTTRNMQETFTYQSLEVRIISTPAFKHNTTQFQLTPLLSQAFNDMGQGSSLTDDLYLIEVVGGIETCTALPFGNPVVNSEVYKTLNKTFSLPACCDRDQTMDPCTGAEAAEKVRRSFKKKFEPPNLLTPFTHLPQISEIAFKSRFVNAMEVRVDIYQNRHHRSLAASQYPNRQTFPRLSPLTAPPAVHRRLPQPPNRHELRVQKQTKLGSKRRERDRSGSPVHR